MLVCSEVFLIFERPNDERTILANSGKMPIIYKPYIPDPFFVSGMAPKEISICSNAIHDTIRTTGEKAQSIELTQA